LPASTSRVDISYFHEVAVSSTSCTGKPPVAACAVAMMGMNLRLARLIVTKMTKTAVSQ
jgi:hypothetical protein